jgi:hypothetical protein
MRTARTLATAAAIAALAACGGGSDDDSWLYPLWVPTDVVVADLDGDGRADVLTSAGLARSADQREGDVTVYRQTAPGRFVSESRVVGRYAWTLTVGDVDGDGAPDLLVVDAGVGGAPQQLWLLRQEPLQRGRLAAPRLLLETTRIERAVLADLTGDGVPDIATAGNAVAPAEAGLTLLPQSAAARGSFGPAQVMAMPGRVSTVAVGDVDGDGRADLVAQVTTSPSGVSPPVSSLWLSRQPAAGSFAPPALLADTSALIVQRLLVRDLDADGRADVAAFGRPCCFPPGRLIVARQLTAGGFDAAVTPLDGVQGIDDAAFADFDGDGRVDAAVAGFFPVGSPSTVHTRLNLFRQQPGGGFAQVAATELPFSASRAAAGDVDGDGRPDLVLLGGTNQAWLLLNSAAQPGTFGAPQRLP